jgi:hypothetical protein
MPADSMMRSYLNRINSILEGITSSVEVLGEARQRLSPEEVKARELAANEKRKQQMREKAQGGPVPAGLRRAAQATGRQTRKAAAARKAEVPIQSAMPPAGLLQKQAARKAKEKERAAAYQPRRADRAMQQRWAGAEGNIRAAAKKQREGEAGRVIRAGKAGDTDKAAKLRFGKVQAAGGPAKGAFRQDIRGVQHSPLVKAARLMNIQLNRRHNEKVWHGQGVHERPHVERPQNQEPRNDSGKRVPKYHHDVTAGKVVHSSGRRDTKKFANNTTFRPTPDDAMLHTDKSQKGTRASAGEDEFAFHGNLDKDPRQKWYRVSAQGGYPSAMASLGKIYHKDPKMRAKVVQKVKSVQFPGAHGHSIRVHPTGALHNERTACMRDKKGNLHPEGHRLQAHDPGEFNRLCKGAHGPSGTPDRDEYKAGFDPKHSDPSKLHALHRAALHGKGEKPSANIAQHAAARPLRRKFIKKAVRHMIGQGVRSGRAFAAGE